MPRISRVFLLTLAVVLIVAVFCLGTSFTYSAESPDRAHGSDFFWLLFAGLFASPLWVPAIVSASSRGATIAVHGISAVLLLVPLRYACSVALHQLHIYPSPWFSAGTFAVGALLSVGCVSAIVVLLWPCFRRVARQAA
jgi:hypothetical protein